MKKFVCIAVLFFSLVTLGQDYNLNVLQQHNLIFQRENSDGTDFIPIVYLNRGNLGFNTESPVGKIDFIGNDDFPPLLKFTIADSNEGYEGFWFDAAGITEPASGYLTLMALESSASYNPVLMLSTGNVALGGVKTFVSQGLVPEVSLHVVSGNVGKHDSKNGVVSTYIDTSFSSNTSCTNDEEFSPALNYNGDAECDWPRRYGLLKSNASFPVIMDKYENIITFNIYPYGSDIVSETDEISLKISIGTQNAFLVVYDKSNGENYAKFSNSKLAVPTGFNSEKQFIISHPSEGYGDYYLVHAAVEGPSSDVAYYGESRLNNGSVVVHLPEYVSAFTSTDDFTIHLTPVDGFDGLAIRRQNGQFIQDNTFIVYSDNTSSSQRFNYRVIKKRIDSPQFDVEPLKSSVQIFGDGPYKYYKEIDE